MIFGVLLLSLLLLLLLIMKMMRFLLWPRLIAPNELPQSKRGTKRPNVINGQSNSIFVVVVVVVVVARGMRKTIERQ